MHGREEDADSKGVSTEFDRVHAYLDTVSVMQIHGKSEENHLEFPTKRQEQNDIEATIINKQSL